MVADVSTLNNVRCNYENEKFAVGITSITSGKISQAVISLIYYFCLYRLIDTGALFELFVCVRKLY